LAAVGLFLGGIRDASAILGAGVGDAAVSLVRHHGGVNGTGDGAEPGAIGHVLALALWVGRLLEELPMSEELRVEIDDGQAVLVRDALDAG
jgi:hypothetical protein